MRREGPRFSTVPGRLGVGQPGAPYTNPFSGEGYCERNCAASTDAAGYRSCKTFNHVVTVWRNFDVGTDYKICNRKSGKCLDVAEGSTAAGAALVQNAFGASTTSQRWRITQLAPSQYQVLNVKSNFALDVASAQAANGTAILQRPFSGTGTQKWTFKPTKDGYYQIHISGTPRSSLNIKGGSTGNGATAEQWDWNSWDSQNGGSCPPTDIRSNKKGAVGIPTAPFPIHVVKRPQAAVRREG